MMFKLAAASALFALVCSVTAAPAPAPEAELAQRDSFRLPPYLQLFANVDGTDIGCINGFGNYSTGNCYPFRVTYTSGNNNNDGILNAYAACDLGSGPLDGAKLDCSSGANGNLGQFWLRDGFLSVDGPTGVIFSINGEPNPNNTNQYGIGYGSDLIIGGSGTYKQFKLRVHSTRG